MLSRMSKSETKLIWSIILKLFKLIGWSADWECWRGSECIGLVMGLNCWYDWMFPDVTGILIFKLLLCAPKIGRKSSTTLIKADIGKVLDRKFVFMSDKCYDVFVIKKYFADFGAPSTARLVSFPLWHKWLSGIGTFIAQSSSNFMSLNSSC